MLKICNSMYEVQKFLNGHCSHCDPNEVLCCFDIAETMITCSHPASYPGNRNEYKSELETIRSNYDVFDFVHFITSTYPSQIFDDTFREAFAQIPYRKIALTAAMTGSCSGYIDRLEVTLYECLKEHNIIFDDPLFADKDIILDNLPSYMGYYPVCYKGVLCSNGENTTTNKGSALCGLLKKINFTPEYVIQIDDKQLNLDFINEELSKQFPNIKFIGILYTGAENYCPQDISREDFIDFWVGNCEKIKDFRKEYR